MRSGQTVALLHSPFREDPEALVRRAVKRKMVAQLIEESREGLEVDQVAKVLLRELQEELDQGLRAPVRAKELLPYWLPNHQVTERPAGFWPQYYYTQSRSPLLLADSAVLSTQWKADSKLSISQVQFCTAMSTPIGQRKIPHHQASR